MPPVNVFPSTRHLNVLVTSTAPFHSRISCPGAAAAAPLLVGGPYTVYGSHHLVYARHGRELMGCKSPVREPKGVHMLNTIKSTSRRQGRFREEWSEGSLSAKVRADEQKSYHPQAGTRAQSPGELARHNEARRFRG